MEFPREELEALAKNLAAAYRADSSAYIRKAITVYDQLAERCTRDRTEASLHIANLRARLLAVDPEFK